MKSDEDEGLYTRLAPMSITRSRFSGERRSHILFSTCPSLGTTTKHAQLAVYTMYVSLSTVIEASA